MSEDLPPIDFDDEFVEDYEVENEKFIRSRIKTNVTTGIKIKRMIFWILYIMVFYFFGSWNSAYGNFLMLNGSDRIDGMKFLMGFLILVISSNIAGPIAGGMGALLGDLIFQIVTIKSIKIEYLLFAVLVGVAAGLFRFNKEETLKKMKVMRVFYTMVGVAVASLGLFFLIMWIRNPGMNWETASGTAFQFNTLQFFFSEIVTFLFFGPILIAILDRVLRWASNPEGIAYRFFFTHHYEEKADHAIPLDFGGYHFFVCTRCSGTVSGILLMVFIDYVLLAYNNNVEIISPTVAFILCIVFTLPALADWGTQKLLLRTSNDTIRLITGLFLGAAIHLLTLSVVDYTVGVIIVLVVSFGAFILMFILGNRKLRSSFLKDMEKAIVDKNHDSDEVSEN